jgi:hypothetical protein
VYLGGVNARFHHNFVDNTTDDGLYLSPMYARYDRLLGIATVHIHQNVFRRALTMIAYGGSEKQTTDKFYFYRNIVDLREPVRASRPTTPGGTVTPYYGKLTGDHGSPPWPTMFSYHNTIIAREPSRYADMGCSQGATTDRPRRVFNNIFIHADKLPPFALPTTGDVHSDGNLFWNPNLAVNAEADYFKVFRASKAFVDSQRVYAPGFDAQSLAANPKFVQGELAPLSVNVYRLQPDSPAINAGLALPGDWPDPVRSLDQGKPDIGALPLGFEPFRVGRTAR